jgi:hypothetical protein
MKENNNSNPPREQGLNSQNSESSRVKKATVKNKSKKPKAKSNSLKSAVKKHKKATRGKAKNQTKKSSVNPQIKKSIQQSKKIDSPKENWMKFSTTQLKKLEDEFLQDSTEILPDGYGDHRLTLIARDPHWAFCFWEIDSEKLEQRLIKLGERYYLKRWNLRVYRNPTGKNENGELVSDFAIDLESGKLYLELSPAGSTFIAELGIMDKQNNFGRILTSNTIDLPAGSPSNNDDEHWTTGENIEKIFIQSAKSGVEKPELNIHKRSIEPFGESSASRYTNSKR